MIPVYALTALLAMLAKAGTWKSHPLQEDLTIRVPRLLGHEICSPAALEPSSRHTQTSVPRLSEPWTAEPICYGQIDSDDYFCVYTDSKFSRCRGISLVTKPSVAQHVVKSAAFAKPETPENANKFDNLPFVEQIIPGKGVGMIAKRTIYRGDVVITETPAMIIHRARYQALEEPARLMMQNRGVNNLPQPVQRAFLNMTGHRDSDPVDDIITTNSFTVNVGENDNQHDAIFIQTSRLNHDCRPNCNYNFDPETLVQNVYALRDIYPGEEITVSYINPTSTYRIRQAILYHNWGFNCSCLACSLSKEEILAADKRINLIKHFTNLLNNWSEESLATPAMGDELVSLYEQERIFGHIGYGYLLAAYAYNAVGDKVHMLKNSARALEYGLTAWGYHDSSIREILQLTSNPESHWSWKRRHKDMN